MTDAVWIAVIAAVQVVLVTWITHRWPTNGVKRNVDKQPNCGSGTG